MRSANPTSPFEERLEPAATVIRASVDSESTHNPNIGSITLVPTIYILDPSDIGGLMKHEPRPCTPTRQWYHLSKASVDAGKEKDAV